MKWTVTTPPSQEPVTYADLKAQCRLDDDYDQLLLTNLGIAARTYAETLLNRSIVTQTIEVTHYGSGEATPVITPPACNFATLPRGPVQSITGILDTFGNTVATSNYQLRRRGNIDYVWFQNMPSYPITVTYVAGYGSPAQVPQHLKTGILLHAAHLYRNREAASPEAQNSVPYGLDAIYGVGHSGEMIG